MLARIRGTIGAGQRAQATFLIWVDCRNKHDLPPIGLRFAAQFPANHSKRAVYIGIGMDMIKLPFIL